jgi:SAM-dependent methyltransferase
MIASEELPRTIARFCCPYCRSELALSGTVARCVACGHTANCLSTNLLSFLPDEATIVRTIFGWPPEFIERLATWVRVSYANSSPAGNFRDELIDHGLIRSDDSLTPLGEDVQYHVSEYKWQTRQRGLDGMLELAGLCSGTRVLDVGCGAAQTLRQMELDRPIELLGVDTNPRALALGCRFARLQNLPVTLAMATAYALPFRDDSVDLVLSRVALNYMHQRRALTEMVRVLRPGGIIFCRAERIWHDFSLIVRTRSARWLVGRCLDLGYGVVHSLTGLQMTPGRSQLRGRRAFATEHRLGQTLKSLGCCVLRRTEIPNCQTILGHRTQLIVVARKDAATG